MKEQKVLMHWVKTGGYSGAEKIAIKILAEMNRRGIRCIYVSPKGGIEDILKQEEIEHVQMKRISIFELQRIIDKYDPDIIHAHDFTMSVLSSFLKSPAKRISHIHNNATWIKRRGIRSYLYKRASKKIDSILLVSESIEKEYVFSDSIKSKIRIVGNPFNAKEIRDAAAKAECVEKSDVMFLGRLEIEKNPYLFLDIVGGCKKKRRDLQALIIGDGRLRTSIEQKCKEELGSTIKMLGFQKNPYGLLKNTKILCVTSKWEGFGLVVLEAFALGIPVVVTNVGGMRQFVNDNNGKISNDIKVLQEEVINLLENKEYYKLKSQAAYQTACKYSNQNDYMDELYKEYVE